jgi:protein-S-isoprenylcysteine O-methyltransferase Ste14
MSLADPYLLVRGAALYFVAVSAAAIWVLRRPSARDAAGAALAWCWNLPALLALHLAAERMEWWRFDATGGLLLGMPVDLCLAWAWLWGALPALALPRVPLVVLAAGMLALDLVLMPLGSPVLEVGPTWIAGELAGLAACLVPSQLLARWTQRDERLAGRAVLQIAAFGGLMMFVLPAIVIEGSGTAWAQPWRRPVWQFNLMTQLLAVPALIGLSAVHEFVTRGGGTPVPFDPPRRLVTTGLYAYVRNPMQISGVLLLGLLGLVLENLWISAAGVMAHVYASGLAAWDEGEDLRRRFGQDWLVYRGAVRAWLPRWRPWLRNHLPPAQLFVAEHCGMCSEVGAWFARRHAAGLAIVPAALHPSGALTRVTYEPADGSTSVNGIRAIARALDHLHLGWALAGALLRLPVVAPAVQLLVDASGGQTRPVSRRTVAP